MKILTTTQTLAYASEATPTDAVLATATSEIVGRTVLMVLMIFIARGSYERLLELAAPLSAGGSAVTIMTLMSELGAFSFAILVCVLAVMRLKPVKTAVGWAPLVSALGGAFVLTVVNNLPATALPMTLTVIAVVLLAIGNVGTVICLSHLGQSFSVLPQARRLVSSGPYALIRHPLYVAEGIATLGMVLLHFGWLSVAICLVQFALQFARIHYEEAILTAAFPEYVIYAERTPRFIPRM